MVRWYRMVLGTIYRDLGLCSSATSGMNKNLQFG